MANWNKLLFCTIGICLAFLLTLRFAPGIAQKKRTLQEKPNITPTIIPEKVIVGDEYVFNSPKIAKEALSLLDVYHPVDESYFVARLGVKHHFGEPFFGLKVQEDYCEKQRNHFVENPESVFEQVSIFNTRPGSALINRRVIPEIGVDAHPNIGTHRSEANKNKYLYNLKKDINVFFTTRSMYEYRELGKQFSCLAQSSNHIPGHQTLNRKDAVAENIINYAKKFENRPQCFNYEKYFPKTWVLYNEEDCLEFFRDLNSSQYEQAKKERGIVYIRKVGAGSHRGLGVQPVDEDEEAALKTLYENGNKCGKVRLNYIVQSYVHNPLLLNKRKFDFRMYMLIASTNPLVAYYHDGFLRVALFEYDANSGNKTSAMTNLAIVQGIHDKVKAGELFEGMNEEELKVAQQWSFQRLRDYLMENRIISDPNWLDNYLRPEFKKAMIHLLRSSSYAFLKHSSLYELYGVDFMLDENLNLWFLEANSGPGLDGYSQPMEKFIVKMIKDHFEIVMGLLRSRMKRVINYVNTLVETGQIRKSGSGIVINDLETKRMVFARITQNYYEKEFLPSFTNGFQLFWDGNEEGASVYQGFVSKDCL